MKQLYNLSGLAHVVVLALLLACLPGWVMAQNASSAQRMTLRGTVTDAADGSPVIGASILIKSTASGTMTDVNGSFSLDVAPGDVLVVTFIGYVTSEVTVGNRSTIDIPLKVNSTSLEEVVVVGFGEQKKANLTGAISVVDSKVLEARPIQSVGQALQGVVPNLNVDFGSGAPGAVPNINIRGMASITGAQPLVVVDNVPMTVADLNLIAPSDIKSISVIKDASASTIYGSRGAAGVILITTKSGVREGFNVEYNNNFSWGSATVLPNKVTDPYIYMRTLETATDNTPWDYVNYTPTQYAWARERSDNPSSSGPVRIDPEDNALWAYMGNRDWTKYYLDNPTLSVRHNVNLSGKSGNTGYYISGAYDSQNGALKVADDKYERYSIRSKLAFTPYKWLTFGNNTQISLTNRVTPSQLSMEDLFNLFPTSWDRNPDGSWANTDVGRAAARMVDGGQSVSKVNMFQTTFTGELSFWERMLRVNADFTARRDTYNYRSNSNKLLIGYGPDDIREEGANTAERLGIQQSYYVLNTYATFEKTFAQKHYVNAIVGFNQEYNRMDSVTTEKVGVISPSIPSVGLATGLASVDESIREWALRGAFYRLNYIFRDRYIVEFDGRYDGSSKFRKDKRFGFYPSVSAGWKVDQESFWKPIATVVNTLKIRGSYGSAGNQSSISEYGYVPLSSLNNGEYLIGGALPSTVSSPYLVSDNYGWEDIRSSNLGIDVGLLQQRITASFDVYRRDTKGMLMPGKELPAVLGVAPPRENAADLRATGWELSLGYDDEFSLAGKSLHAFASFVISDNRTEITKFDNPNRSLTQYYEGMTLGEVWGLRSDGMFKNQEEIDALDESTLIPWGALDVVPGWPKYKDLDNSGSIEKGSTVDDPKDLSVIGNITPRFRFGFTVGAEWNGFDLRAFFQGVGKMDYYPINYLYWGYYQQPYAGGYAHLLDFYRGEGDSEAERAQHSQSYINAGLADANVDAKYPVLQAWLADKNLGERIDRAQGLAIPQTGYMQNGAYLRLKNITIGYSLPHALLDRIHVNKLRVYVSGENLTEWSAIKKYYDPEAITNNISKTNPNYDPVDNSGSDQNGWGYAYPFQRKYSFGIELQF
jgi:TonB-linked SusC/RagA family outer membrane protein